MPQYWTDRLMRLVSELLPLYAPPEVNEGRPTRSELCGPTPNPAAQQFEKRSTRKVELRSALASGRYQPSGMQILKMNRGMCARRPPGSSLQLISQRSWQSQTCEKALPPLKASALSYWQDLVFKCRWFRRVGRRRPFQIAYFFHIIEIGRAHV